MPCDEHDDSLAFAEVRTVGIFSRGPLGCYHPLFCVCQRFIHVFHILCFFLCVCSVSTYVFFVSSIVFDSSSLIMIIIIIIIIIICHLYHLKLLIYIYVFTTEATITGSASFNLLVIVGCGVPGKRVVVSDERTRLLEGFFSERIHQDEDDYILNN